MMRRNRFTICSGRYKSDPRGYGHGGKSAQSQTETYSYLRTGSLQSCRPAAPPPPPFAAPAPPGVRPAAPRSLRRCGWRHRPPALAGQRRRPAAWLALPWPPHRHLQRLLRAARVHGVCKEQRACFDAAGRNGTFQVYLPALIVFGGKQIVESHQRVARPEDATCVTIRVCDEIDVV